MKRITFSVSGVKGKGRPRASIIKGHPHIYTPKDTHDFEMHVATVYMLQGGFKFEEGLPLRISIRVFQAVPKGTSKANRKLMEEHRLRPMKLPDIDNVTKLVMDALNGVAYADDRQVVEIKAAKWYANENSMEITVSEVSE
jgi:Holliday junction resolvase RusA-like endonuclease